MSETAKNNINKTISYDNWSRESLQLLYDICNNINTAATISELQNGFLATIVNSLNAFAGVIRMITDEGLMDLTAAYGLDDRLTLPIQHTPIEVFLFYRHKNPVKDIHQSSAAALVNIPNAKTLAVPVRYEDQTLGVLNLFYKSESLSLDEEKSLLLVNAGRHLGCAINRFHLQNKEKQKLIQEERNMIANELHDSLAQTLASLRFQVRILDETLQPSSEYMAIMGIEQVEHGLDEAYTDLRELIAHCRVPIEQQGLVPSIKRVVDKFREETGIHILLQCDNNLPDIPANMEMHVYRIVQESLTNIKKHAHAHIVRVLLACDAKGNYRVLIENDGIGFDKRAIKNKEGQHLGLTIMQERAKHLGGKLKIESEPDEGTRVELRFQYKRE